MAFIDDIQSRDTALYPIVEIGVQDNKVADTTSIRISTKPVTLYQESGEPTFNQNWFYSPLLLSSPSIKESIDLENRKYKISNVSLKISNIEYNGERVSDNPVLKINAYVNIYWISPSIEKYLGANTDTGRNYGYLAYFGVIRAITHDEKTCNITLEDTSQSTLHRDVPVELLPTTESVPEKYRGKPVPMVYGEVNKSPCVVRSSSIDDDTGQGVVTISSDNLLIEGTTADNPLIIFKDLYWEVFPDAPYAGVGSLTGEEYKVAHQYIRDGNNFLIQGILNTYSDLNLIADGAAQVINKNQIEGLTKYKSFGAEEYVGDLENIGLMIDSNLNTYGTVMGIVSYSSEFGGENTSPGGQGGDIETRVVVALYAKYPQLQTEDIFSDKIITLYHPNLDITASEGQSDTGQVIPHIRFWTGGLEFTCQSGETETINQELILENEILPDRFSLIWDCSDANAQITFVSKIYDLKVDTVLDIDKFFESDFYANIIGRV